MAQDEIPKRDGNFNAKHSMSPQVIFQQQPQPLAKSISPAVILQNLPKIVNPPETPKANTLIHNSANGSGPSKE